MLFDVRLDRRDEILGRVLQDSTELLVRRQHVILRQQWLKMVVVGLARIPSLVAFGPWVGCKPTTLSALSMNVSSIV
jgi:hypothetical protein